MAANRAVPVALTIAGSDCSAGAGAQADLKTFSALGIYGLTAITCVVAETPGKVERIQGIDPSLVAEQMTLLLESFPIGAIKTGLLYSAEVASAVAKTLRDWNSSHPRRIPLVIDPVMVATSGALLLQEEAIAVYENDLFPLASVVTPNLDEAATLLGHRVSDLSAMREAGQKLVARYGTPVLLKGGHLGGEDAIDLLCTAEKVVEFSAPFTRGVETHGTGCTYSAAITAGLANGFELEAAIGEAKRFVTQAIAQHFSWKSKSGANLHALNQSPS